ncbi:MAG: DUF6049 family protein [Gulosibacter sp.]|uniref:DUF6049 family protein n=1 Tax=Gulosibacter sp. TaxID=2817531 RepID=UPI003F904854
MSDAPHPRAPRLWRRVVAATAVVLGLGGAVPSLAAAAPATAPDAATAPAGGAIGDGVDGELSAEIVLLDGGVLTADEETRATVVLMNRTEEVADASEIALLIDSNTIDTRYELNQWTGEEDPDADTSSGTEVFRDVIGAIQPGATFEIPVTLSAEATESLNDGQFGARGITLEWETNGEVVAQDRATFVWNAESLASPVSISPIVPIVSDLGEEELLSIAELEILTAPQGDLTLLVDAVAGTDATLAIDPRLLVSIRALGADAPATAVAWLERLEQLENESFPLEFADASLTLQQQAGLEQPLQPTGFSYATADHEFFTVVEPDETPTPTPTNSDPTASETVPPTPPADPTDQLEAEPQPSDPSSTEPAGTDPTATDPEGTVAEDAPEPTQEEEEVLEPRPAPDLEELMAFDYTRPELEWPAAGTVSDLDALSDWGAGAIVLSGDQVTLSPDRYATPSSQHQVAGTEVLVTDAELDAAIASTVTATEELDFRDASAEVATLLAVIARELPNEARQIVTTLPRAALEDPELLAQLLDAMAENSWTELDSIPDRAEDPTVLTETELLPGSHSDAAIAQFEELATANERGLELTALYAEPQAVAEELRAKLLYSIRLPIIDTDGWTPVAHEFIEFATAAADQISVAEGSEIQLIGHDSSLPIFIENQSDREVIVEVRLRATTGHLTVTDTSVITIPAGGVTRASIPVQAIANGVSSVEATLWTVENTQLNNSAELVVNVHASLETVAVSLLIGAGVLLFVVGVWRTIRRRKRDRADEVGESTDATTASTPEAVENTGESGSSSDT